MTRRLATPVVCAIVLFAPLAAYPQSNRNGIERALGLPDTRQSGVEVRIWPRENLRVETVYRIVKTDINVSVERFAWTTVERPAKDGNSETEARRETRENRRLLQMERCDGKIVETADYMWCRLRIREDRDWSLVYADLLPDELWTLPPEGDRSCGSLIVLDGVTVEIDVLAPGRRHAVSYSNPRTCCRTVACAIVDHVHNVVVDNIR